MRGARYDVEVRQGADFWILFRPMEREEEIVLTLNGLETYPEIPVNLTGITFRSQFRAVSSDGLVELDLAASDFTNETIDGKVFVVMRATSVKTKTMVAAKGVYDIEMTDASGAVVEVLWGNYTLAYEVTKP